MPSELALHIGVNGRHRDGDILAVTFTYDAQRLIAETISKGRHSAVRDPEHIAALALLYGLITDPNKQPQPTPAALARWWTDCETLTGLDRNDFTHFPYTPPDRRFMLIVPLDREATPADRALWTGKTADRDRGIAPIPKRVDWETDVMGDLRVRRGREGGLLANANDVRDPTQRILVLDPISPDKIRSRA